MTGRLWKQTLQEISWRMQKDFLVTRKTVFIPPVPNFVPLHVTTLGHVRMVFSAAFPLFFTALNNVSVHPVITVILLNFISLDKLYHLSPYLLPPFQ
ncbi:hypothetical protein M405DRAFT_823780 [Rhizopogon salebrosus TDB-379]|nr:hypothetical protein M405DRAFT_823780 [Rhizopogon salebrosus TDB-379]